MVERRILPWVGLLVLVLFLGFSQRALAQETYKVKRGDTLSRIAKKFSLSQDALKKANNLPGDSIRYQQVLVIPSAGGKKSDKIALDSASASLSTAYYVAKGDTLYSIAKKAGTSVASLKEINHLRSSKLKLGQKILLAKAIPPAIIAAPTEVNDPDEDDDSDEVVSLSMAPAEEAQDDTEIRPALLGSWNSPEEKRLFVKVATAFLGAPYRWGGSSLHGLDCSAFVKKIYELFDISLPRTAFEQSHVGARIAREDLQEGDLVFFNTKRSYGHVGIYIGDGKFVHASSHNRVIKIDSLSESYFNKRFAKAVRLKGDENSL